MSPFSHSTWREITRAIRLRVSNDVFQRWFKDIQFVSADDNQITLCVHNNIHRLWIETNYMELLQTSIMETWGSPLSVRLTIADTAAETVPNEPLTTVCDMNPKNTFDSFVVDHCNRFAYEAALAAAQKPARVYNPLFICGALGLGKTHLLHAIGQHTASNNAEAKVIYLPGEKFTIEFIDAIKSDTLVCFRDKYRQADMLLVDDIQFFAGKQRSEEEFLHTFNALLDCHKQIILSCSTAPSEIPNLDARLISRFEWGLIAELRPPDYEMRMAILHKKMEALGGKSQSVGTDINELFLVNSSAIHSTKANLSKASLRVGTVFFRYSIAVAES